MIPKIIHQTAKNSDIPPKWKLYQEKVQSLHPEWEYRLWTDEDNLLFVQTEFPEFLDIFRSLPKNIMRADVIRYLIMFKIGGLYLDLDYEMLKPFDLTNYQLVLPYNRSIQFGDSYNGIGNCFFASSPGHPFWKIVIDDLHANPPIGENIDVEDSTGPAYLTRIFNRTIENHFDIFTPERKLFHPPTPMNNREYRKIVEDNISYGIHHCHGTWRERKNISRIISLIKHSCTAAVAQFSGSRN